MLIPILCSLGACFFWGFTSTYETLFHECSITDVIIIRHFVFGLFTCCCLALFPKKKSLSFKIKPAVLGIASLLSFVQTFCFYIGFFGCAYFYKTPVIALVLFGCSPVVTTIYDSILQKVASIKKLLIPLGFMLFGILILHFSHNPTTTQAIHIKDLPLKNIILGLACGCLALFSWSLYVVYNSKFLQKHKDDITPNQLTSLIGIESFFTAMICVVLFNKFQFSNLNFHLNSISSALVFLKNPIFICKSLFVGIFCTWLPVVFWNKASSKLPGYILGPILLSETIFGLIFIFILKNQIPDKFCIIGSLSMLLGSFLCLTKFSKSIVKH